ncbi:MAG: ABC transporter ATP-binding protein [Oscillospiraceae bacterium]|nr:ABC transporter ATP-binding protein [Oscillospiraceae bacterium]
MAIEMNAVSKKFDRVYALDNVSVSFGGNMIYGLLGNNGAGKSTALNIITNRLFASSGTVTVDGEPVANNDHALGKMFLMGENNMYPSDMRVKKAFESTALFYPKFSIERAMQLSEKFGLNTRSKITALSTGYASIFRLILALTADVKYLLLDEPVLGLDAQHRDMFYRLLMEKYAEKPCTIVLSTHLISEVENLVERAVIISGGRIIRDAPVEELMRDCYSVTGTAARVDEFTADKTVLSEYSMGGIKSAGVQGHIDTAPEGLELAPMKLQDYFISLMENEEAER